ncbi:M48 family metallopeptidase [Anoxybacter fermentans]|uniref:M48 metallopeptidase family protein n=1 Tax=Anoxybacter fermentans TaxID=1323375 RepID=UPI000F8E8EBA|nr:M48 family metallopeptidase [Anoxybacter fermentans]
MFNDPSDDYTAKKKLYCKLNLKKGVLPVEKYPFQLKEEVIFKKGIRCCSGRIREGKLLYYLPRQMKRELVEKVLAEIRQNLILRLKDAYRYYNYFRKCQSHIHKSYELKKMAEEIYTRKYSTLDFSLTIKFRRQKTVMGTYRRKKDGKVVIYINDHFKNAPEFLLEYVIAHELSHHHFSGHDQAFYRELSQLCPDHKKKRKLANQYLLLKEAEIF